MGTFGRWGSDDNFIVRASARYPFVSSTIETAILVNHAESSSMDPKRAHRETVAGSTHFDYVIGHCYQLQADILADQMTLGSRSGDVLNRGDRAAIVQRVSERLRADILWWFVYRTLPWAARDEIQTLRRHLRSLGAPRWQTLTLSATETLARRIGAAFWLLSTTARSIVALGERRRLGRLRQRGLTPGRTRSSAEQSSRLEAMTPSAPHFGPLARQTYDRSIGMELLQGPTAPSSVTKPTSTTSIAPSAQTSVSSPDPAQARSPRPVGSMPAPTSRA